MSQASKYENKNSIHQYILRKFLKHIEQAVSDANAIEILEIGCADGYVIKYLTEHNPRIRVRGVDLNREALRRAQEMNPNAHFEYGDALTIRVPDKQFDTLMALELLEHIQDFEAALQNLQKINARYFLLSVPHEPFFRMLNFLRGRHWHRLGNHPGHINTWGKDEFKRIISPYFTIEKDLSSFPWTK